MQDSEALVLEILREGQILKMSIFKQEELASTLRRYSQCPVSFPEINRLCQEVISVLAKSGKTSAYNEDLIKGLAKAGQLLWEHLFSRPVKEALKSARNTDLILSIDEELINIPWEFLHDGSDFLCLAFNMGRVIRTKEQLSLPRYRSSSSLLKMLILANPTDDLKSAYQEGINIKNQFDKKRNSVRIDFKSTYIDKLYVKKNLCDYDLVHFAGHCEYDADNPGNSGWVLSDGRFTVRDILAMGSTASLPALVFSNACYFARDNLACAFLFSGVRHYIGAIRRIEDPASFAFSKEFYTQLIGGSSLGESARRARLRLIEEYGIASLHWSSYLLYGDPGFVLFGAEAKPKAASRKTGFRLQKKQLARISAGIAIVAVCICLYARLLSINPSTYCLYLKSKKLSQSGRNQEVILQCLGIIKKEPLFHPAYPLLADAYQRSGDRVNALKYYFEYALLCEKKSDKKNLASAYIAIGWFHHSGGDYPKAFDFYAKAITLSGENKDRLNEAVALRKLAVWHMDKEDYGRALELLTKSSEINRQMQAAPAHRYNLACDFFNMGLLFTNKDDLATAKEFYNKSLKLFEGLRLKRELSDYYFNLGEICAFEKEYQKALNYYSKGLAIDRGLNNLSSLAGDYDMLGELYAEIGNLPQAEEYFNHALNLSREINAPLELASANYNLGLLYKQKGHKNKAREYLRISQEIYSRIDTPDYQRVKEELLRLGQSRP